MVICSLNTLLISHRHVGCTTFHRHSHHQLVYRDNQSVLLKILNAVVWCWGTQANPHKFSISVASPVWRQSRPASTRRRRRLLSEHKLFICLSRKKTETSLGLSNSPKRSTAFIHLSPCLLEKQPP